MRNFKRPKFSLPHLLVFARQWNATVIITTKKITDAFIYLILIFVIIMSLFAAFILSTTLNILSL